MQQVDLVIYSLASPRRTHPETGETFSSVLKPIGTACTRKTVRCFSRRSQRCHTGTRLRKEIADTVAVMGGNDWGIWMDFLAAENLLAKNVTTVAYSYIGPTLTHAIYRDGTIGIAKKDLHATAKRINQKLASLHGPRIGFCQQSRCDTGQCCHPGGATVYFLTVSLHERKWLTRKLH